MNKSLKSQLKKNSLLIGSWITIPDTNIIEIFSNFGVNSTDVCIEEINRYITVYKKGGSLGTGCIFHLNFGEKNRFPTNFFQTKMIFIL